MERSYNCRKCYRPGTEKVNSLVTAFKADYFICADCDASKYYYTVWYNSKHGRCIGNHPRTSLE